MESKALRNIATSTTPAVSVNFARAVRTWKVWLEKQFYGLPTAYWYWGNLLISLKKVLTFLDIVKLKDWWKLAWIRDLSLTDILFVLSEANKDKLGNKLQDF